MVDCYVIRRKSDGKIYPFGGYSGRQAGRIFKSFHTVAEYYNDMGCGVPCEWEPWSDDTPEWTKRRRPKGKVVNWNHSIRRSPDSYLYTELELVKFSSTGEIVIATNGPCTITTKEAKELRPVNTSPLTTNERRAGLADEMGVILGEIEQVEKYLTAGKPFDIEEITAKIEIKKIRLTQAIEELDACKAKMQESLMKKMGI